MTRFLAILTLFLLIPACSPALVTCKTPQTSRCNGRLVELCSPEKEWQVVMDCDNMGEDWECGPVDKGHACVPSKGAQK